MVSHFGELIRVEEERRKGEEEEGEEEEQKGMELVNFCMETMILVWKNTDFCIEKSNHKPIFF